LRTGALRDYRNEVAAPPGAEGKPSKGLNVEEINLIVTFAVGTAITSLAGLWGGRQNAKLLEKQHSWALDDIAKQATASTASNEKMIGALAAVKSQTIAAIADNTRINTKALDAANGVNDKLATMVSFTGEVGPVDAARVLISIQQTVKLMADTVEEQKKYSHESIHEINRSLALLQEQVRNLQPVTGLTHAGAGGSPSKVIGATLKPTEVS
jgi:hypothetical protein